MKAALCKAWGEPLIVEEIDSPVPAAGEVRVAVHACGVNFGDVLMVAGQYQVRPPFPFAPGFEVAGEVLECGAGVTRFEPGERVLGVCDYGGYAEEIVLDGAHTLSIPDGMSFVEAAAFPVAYGTAHLGLVHRARLQAGEALLVHGAAGGVGTAAVQIGHHLGAIVIATASTADKLQVAADNGATHLINYTEGEGEFRKQVKALTGGKGADVIFDPVGGDVFDQSLRCINWEGRLLVIGFASGRIPAAPANLLLVKNFSVVGLYWGAYMQRDPETLRESLAELLGWYVQGLLKPQIFGAYSLTQADAALEALRDRKAIGKVVVVPQQG